jgi:hypothetical protein
MKHMSIKAIAVIATLFSAGSGSAATLNADAGWTGFAFQGVGTSAYHSFSFTLVGQAVLSVVDGFFAGDRFDVISNGVSQGMTSLPVAGATNLASNWDAAFANPNYSKGTFNFGPGSYTVSLLVTDRSPGTTDHLGAIRLDSIAAVVPVPAGGLLLISALGAAAALRKRRKQAS